MRILRIGKGDMDNDRSLNSLSVLARAEEMDMTQSVRGLIYGAKRSWRKCEYRNLRTGKTIYDGRTGASVDLRFEFYGVTKRHTAVAFDCFYCFERGSCVLRDLWRLIFSFYGAFLDPNGEGIGNGDPGRWKFDLCYYFSFVMIGEFVFLRRFRRSFVFYGVLYGVFFAANTGMGWVHMGILRGE